MKEKQISKPPSHLTTSLEEAMAGLRAQSMTLLAQELMAALLKENYSLDDFLHGLASYTDTKPDWEEVTRHLDLAAEEVSKARREITGVLK